MVDCIGADEGMGTPDHWLDKPNLPTRQGYQWLQGGESTYLIF